ncbi:MAG: rhodanese-like domain-containing protein, partial [Halioglobus sp.]|nr:rhodanese-like domain-containing protein [Halioglobus sp.]
TVYHTAPFQSGARPRGLSIFVDQLAQFFAAHWMLSVAFIFVLGLLIFDLQRNASGNGVSAQQAVRLLNSESAVVVDVRPEGEYERGHIIDAVHIPAREFGYRMGELEKYRERPIVIYCATGMNSVPLVNQLRKQGFQRVFTLSGGIAAWRQDGMPVAR